MASKQRLWQLKQQAQGKCIICSKPAVNRAFCAFHRLQSLINRREKRKERKLKGICQDCNESIDPSNLTYCSKHLERKRK